MLNSVIDAAMALPILALVIGIIGGTIFAARDLTKLDERGVQVAEAEGFMQVFALALLLPLALCVNCVAFAPVGPAWLADLWSHIYPFEILVGSPWWVELMLQVINLAALGALLLGAWLCTRNFCLCVAYRLRTT